jgi:hypothetical protein
VITEITVVTVEVDKTIEIEAQGTTDIKRSTSQAVIMKCTIEKDITSYLCYSHQTFCLLVVSLHTRRSSYFFLVFAFRDFTFHIFNRVEESSIICTA